ncbi:hypothetical protein [Streptacidiphilus sp. EB129]|uniref:hypothetical protein n=1 Tax=Streptacidiphilus sp. EB129 TaxID=3156262 RepID=UPI003517B0F3
MRHGTRSLTRLEAAGVAAYEVGDAIARTSGATAALTPPWRMTIAGTLAPWCMTIAGPLP